MPEAVVKTSRKPPARNAPAVGFLGGGGEMGRRMRALDWAKTPLAPPGGWPVSLRTSVRILLTSRQPMILFWGERMAMLYNESAKGIVSGRHPQALGQPAAAAWPQLWEQAGATLEQVRASNAPAHQEALAIAVEGAGEPSRFAVSFSPLPDDEGGPGGVLCVLNETESFHEAVIGISSELDIQALVQKVTDVATRMTKARFGAFFYNVDTREGGAYKLYALSGAARESFEKFDMPRATPLFAPTFKGEAAVRLDNVTKDPRYGKAAPHHGLPRGHLPVRSYLAVPVVSRSGDVLGGLFFGHPEPAMFNERAERIARAIAAHAAVAIDNASLFGIARGEIEERSRVELALRDSERRYRDVVEGLPAAVYTTDAEGRIQLFNEAAAELWGRRPECGVDLWCGSYRLFHPAGAEMPLENCPMARVLNGELVKGGHEVIIERPDGTRRHALAHPRPLHDASGEVIGAVNMIIDITEHKRAERELACTRDELERQVKVLKQLHELATRLSTLEADGVEAALRVVLDAALRMHGADFGVISAGDVTIRLGTETVEATAGTIQETGIATRGGRRLGSLALYFRERRAPSVRDAQLAEVCARHAADAIEHHRSREALRESEKLYRAIGESINYGVWVCDERGHSIYVSDSFLKLTGLTQGSYEKEIWSSVLHPADAVRVREQWKRCVAEGRDWEAQVQVKTAAGGYRAILCRGVAIRDEQGRITGWAGMNLDIDRLKRVEDELRELDQRKNEFLATLAHELRNPLAPIRNGLEIMRIGRGNAGMVEQARTMMERQLHQMIRLVDDLLDVSRVSRGKIELRREPIELATALSNAIETAKPLIDQNGQTLTLDIPDAPLVVDADLTRLSQVFANLLNNAAKYSDKGGHIAVTVTPGGDSVEVCVRDDGIGIPRDMLDKIFGIFTQVDRSLEKARGGLGIGLSIARRLVEMHGGMIVARSEGPGRGSEFIVRLPAAARVEPPGVVGEAPLPRPGVMRRRVLIADDNSDAASSLAMVLQVMGNEVRVAHDGMEALAVAESFHPDAVLLDIGMPGLNGYEVCRKLRERPATAKAMIVALTGWGQEEDRRRSRDFGFDHHLVKPVEPRTLEKLIQGPGGSRGE